LSPASRYRHDPGYVEAAAAAAGFVLRHRADAVLRFESGKPVDSLIYVHARRA
jgi:predicted TPR repeat methyltransferase